MKVVPSTDPNVTLGHGAFAVFLLIIFFSIKRARASAAS